MKWNKRRRRSKKLHERTKLYWISHHGRSSNRWPIVVACRPPPPPLPPPPALLHLLFLLSTLFLSPAIWCRRRYRQFDRSMWNQKVVLHILWVSVERKCVCVYSWAFNLLWQAFIGSSSILPEVIAFIEHTNIYERLWFRYFGFTIYHVCHAVFY